MPGVSVVTSTRCANAGACCATVAATMLGCRRWKTRWRPLASRWPPRAATWWPAFSRHASRLIGPFPRADLAVTGTVEDLLDEQPALAAEDDLRRRLADPGALTAMARRRDRARAAGPSALTAVTCRSATGLRTCRRRSARPANRRPVDRHHPGQCPPDGGERGQPPDPAGRGRGPLDAERRTALFGEILDLGAQAWLTGTDSAVFAELGDAANFFRGGRSCHTGSLTGPAYTGMTPPATLISPP